MALFEELQALAPKSLSQPVLERLEPSSERLPSLERSSERIDEPQPLRRHFGHRFSIDFSCFGVVLLSVFLCFLVFFPVF